MPGKQQELATVLNGSIAKGKSWGLSTAPVIELMLPASIRTDGGTQARAGLNDATVGEYQEAYNDGAELPPIVVYFDGESYWLADGFHRLNAWILSSQRAGAIRCEIRQGTRRDAVLYACGANDAHGLRRTRADVQRAIDTLLRDPEWAQWSDREIARRCKCHNETVAAARVRLEATDGIRQSETRIGADGRTTSPPLGPRKSSNGSGGSRPADLPPADIATRARSLGLTVATLPGGDITIDDGRNVHQALDADGATLILDALSSSVTPRVKALRARVEALEGTLDPTADANGRYLVFPPSFIPEPQIRRTLIELEALIVDWERAAAAATVVTALPPDDDVAVTPIPIADVATEPIDHAEMHDRWMALHGAYHRRESTAAGIAALALGCHLLGIPGEYFRVALSEVLDDATYGILAEVMG